jgi:hypothetical protein
MFEIVLLLVILEDIQYFAHEFVDLGLEIEQPINLKRCATRMKIYRCVHKM